MPWQSGCSLTSDVTVVDTLASSYTPTTSVTPCGAAEAAATRKRAKYSEIIQSYLFVAIAIEILGPINMDGERFFDSVGERLSSVSGDPEKSHSYIKDYLYSSKFSIRFPFVVLSFPRQLPKVNSRTRFNLVLNPRGSLL